MPTMMFKSVLRPKKSNWGWDFEPDELRELKFQLANLKCKCSACQRMKPLHGIQDAIQIKTHRGIQANRRKNSSDRFIQVTPGSVLSEVYVSQPAATRVQPSTEKTCPKCFAALHTLRTGVTGIVKDEESATTTIITCDKSAGSRVKIVEKSLYRNPVSRASKDLTSSESSVEAPPCPKPNRARVTFSGIRQEELYLKQYAPPLTKPNCTCLEKFIESIRPPIIGY